MLFFLYLSYFSIVGIIMRCQLSKRSREIINYFASFPRVCRKHLSRHEVQRCWSIFNYFY